MNTLVADTERDAASRSRPIAGPTCLPGCALRGLSTLSDSAARRVPWRIARETTQWIVDGPRENIARCVCVISVVCTALYTLPPTSFVGAMLVAGYLGNALASQVRIGGPLFTYLLFGSYLGAVVWGGLWLREKCLYALTPIAG